MPSTESAPPQPAPILPKPSRNEALDGLRGWAALTVVFYHGVLYADPGLVARVLHRPVQELAAPRDVATKLTLAVLNGEVAVQAFFVISGLIMWVTTSGRPDPASAAPMASTARRSVSPFPA